MSYSHPERSLPVATLLILSAGMLDAYTYVGYGGVFANAMTGNIVKLTAAMAGGDMVMAAPFVSPILAYLAGVAVAHAFKERPLRRFIPSAARLALAIEIAFLLFVACLPAHQVSDMAVVAGIAFVAALQATSFTRLEKFAYTSVTTSGNLRHFAESFMRAFVFQRPGHDRSAERIETKFFFILCVCFILGALAGALATLRWRHAAVWMPVAFLSAALILCLPWNTSLQHLFDDE